MAVLEDLNTGDRQELGADHLIGSSDHADTRLMHRSVAPEHARIRWTGRAWVLRDLGSKCGTWAGHRRLGPGESVALFVDATFSIGSADRKYRLVSCDPP